MNLEELSVIKDKEISSDKIVFTRKVRAFCKLPYDGHPKGCPNFNVNPLCPPNSPYREDILKKHNKFVLTWITFDLLRYVEARRKEHPEWSEKMLRNVLYYQGSLKSQLKNYILKRFEPKEIFGCGSGFLKSQSMESAGMLLLDILDKEGNVVQEGMYTVNGIRHERCPKTLVVLSALLCFKKQKTIDDFF